MLYGSATKGLGPVPPGAVALTESPVYWPRTTAEPKAAVEALSLARMTRMGPLMAPA